MYLAVLTYNLIVQRKIMLNKQSHRLEPATLMQKNKYPKGIRNGPAGRRSILSCQQLQIQ